MPARRRQDGVDFQVGKAGQLAVERQVGKPAPQAQAAADKAARRRAAAVRR